MEERTAAALLPEVGIPARIEDFGEIGGVVPDAIREAGIRSGSGAAIIVEGELWGVMGAGLSEGEALPDDLGDRLSGFTELVATAIATEARKDLAASRARIVAAADDQRRRVVGDLHGAQLAAEVVQVRCDVDADDEPLHGRNAYQLHFPAGRTPPISGWWNLDAGRFGVGSTTEAFSTNPDGSLTLYVQHDRPHDAAAANWLPAPEATFQLRMQLYGPSSTVLAGSYRLPPVTATDGS